VRLRHCGRLSNRHRTDKLALCRQLLAVPEPTPLADPSPPDWPARSVPLTGKDLTLCPQCGPGPLGRWHTIRPLRHWHSGVPPGVDAS
jgi:hypothetical protein